MKPIIFSTDMVRAILEGRKTQTRRICKLPNDAEDVSYWTTPTGKTQEGYADPGVNWWDNEGNHIDPCPYGQVGDSVYVRETHYRYGKWLKNGITKTGRQKWTFRPLTKEVRYYNNPPDNFKPNSYRLIAWYKRPSIFMPRWAARIFLEITEVRVERLQEISEQDVISEGFVFAKVFRILWDSINARRGYGWDTNCWCWIISFKRTE